MLTSNLFLSPGLTMFAFFLRWQIERGTMKITWPRNVFTRDYENWQLRHCQRTSKRGTFIKYNLNILLGALHSRNRHQPLEWRRGNGATKVVRRRKPVRHPVYICTCCPGLFVYLGREDRFLLCWFYCFMCFCYGSINDPVYYHSLSAVRPFGWLTFCFPVIYCRFVIMKRL